MKKQKFNRGNIVKLIKEKGRYTNQMATIEGSYRDLFGCGVNKIYSIIFLSDGNSLAWIDEEDLEFIEEGGEYVLEETSKTKEQLYKKYKTIEYIKDNFETGLSSISILYLFDKVGFDTSFKRNGEFIFLHSDWYNLSDAFRYLLNKDKSNMIETLNIVFKEKYRDKFITSFNKFYDEVNI